MTKTAKRSTTSFDSTDHSSNTTLQMEMLFTRDQQNGFLYFGRDTDDKWFVRKWQNGKTTQEETYSSNSIYKKWTIQKCVAKHAHMPNYTHTHTHTYAYDTHNTNKWELCICVYISVCEWVLEVTTPHSNKHYMTNKLR